MSIASPQLPLQTNIPSYPYQQYSDDPNIVAFFSVYNELAQSYLEWFNDTPLGVYTNPNISGPLLDWVGNGVYGISRPAYTALTSKFVAGINSIPINRIAINGNYYFHSGTSTLSSDDFYKRVLTWWFYLGDGRRFTPMLLRKKVARFLYGANGTDVTLSQAQSVSIVFAGYQAVMAGIDSSPINRTAMNGTRYRKPLNNGKLIITVPSGTSSLYFQQAFDQGLLAFPFQLAAEVIISS